MLLSASSLKAQDETAYYQGSSTVQVGYGIGNIWKTLFKLSGAFTTDGTYKVKATGPIALTYEYGASDNISVGVMLGYGKVTGTYTDNTDPADNYEESLTNFSALARANYHFGQSDKFDPYIGIGLGYHNFKYEFKEATPSGFPNTFAIPSAFAYAAQLGARYYVASNFGLYLEVGYVGGSFLQGGLVLRF